jgi:hypothetical protein
MNILLVHQNFPGQYRELFPLAHRPARHNIVFLTQRKDVTPIEGAEIVVYKPTTGREGRLCAVVLLGGLRRQRLWRGAGLRDAETDGFRPTSSSAMWVGAS